MSLEDLKADLARNIADLDAVPMFSVDDMKKYLKETIWPFVQNVVDEIEEMDGDISDLVENSEDILQPETAGIFAVVIVQALDAARELEKRLKKNDTNDMAVRKKLEQLRKVCEIAQQTLMDITVHPDPSKDNENGNDSGSPEAQDDQEGDGGGGGNG